MKIKIYQADTYPAEIAQIRNRLKFLPDTLIHELKTAKFINDRLRAEEWKPTEGLGELFLSLIHI